MEKKSNKPVTRCTEELIEKMANVVRMGLPIFHAAILCGVTSQTYYQWCRKAERKMPGHKPIYAVLHYKMQRARTEAVYRRLNKCDELAQGIKGVPLMHNGEIVENKITGEIIWALPPLKPDVSMNKFLLQVLDSNEFVPATKLEHAGKDGGPIKSENKNIEMTEEQLDLEIAKLRKIALEE